MLLETRQSWFLVGLHRYDVFILQFVGAGEFVALCKLSIPFLSPRVLSQR